MATYYTFPESTSRALQIYRCEEDDSRPTRVYGINEPHRHPKVITAGISNHSQQSTRVSPCNGTSYQRRTRYTKKYCHKPTNPVFTTDLYKIADTTKNVHVINVEEQITSKVTVNSNHQNVMLVAGKLGHIFKACQSKPTWPAVKNSTPKPTSKVTVDMMVHTVQRETHLKQTDEPNVQSVLNLQGRIFSGLWQKTI